MAKKLMFAGLVCVAGSFATVALHARRVQLGYELVRVRERHGALSREVERLRFECASRGSPVEILRRARAEGLDLGLRDPRP